jgi:uncharacterized protein
MKKSLPVILMVGIMLFFLGCGKSSKETDKNNVVNLALEYFDLLIKGNYEQAVQNYDSTMTEALPPDKLKELWTFFIAQAGAYKRQTGIRTEKVDNYESVFVSGEYENMNATIKVVFDNNKKIAGMFFVDAQSNQDRYQLPTYAHLDAFEEREVVVKSGQWSLPGTLTVPKGDSTYPAVVLVHGSGPNDRDETVGPNKPFRDLAYGLASRGIAVLAYDKRTMVYGGSLGATVDKMTVKDETIDDALAAVELLRHQPNIDPNKIFVLGHSLGAMLIPRIGIRDNKIAGFIIMAGSARPLEDVVLEQVSYLYSLGDSTMVDSSKEVEEIKAQVARVKDKNLSASTPASDLPLGIPAAYWLDLRGYNPPEAAKKLTQPILILQGERDYQVTMEDFHLWKTTLESQANVTLKSYPKLNHLFIEGEGKSTPEEYQVAGHVAEEVIDDIAGWIKAH